jgi:hypothetical protein
MNQQQREANEFFHRILHEGRGKEKRKAVWQKDGFFEWLREEYEVAVGYKMNEKQIYDFRRAFELGFFFGQIVQVADSQKQKKGKKNKK